MLYLTDPRWSQLQSTYGDGTRVTELLARAASDTPFDTWYDDLFQELCHQYSVSEAAFAALPHLVNLARDNREARKHLLVLAGSCYTFSQLPGTPPIPAGLAEVLSAEQLSESDLHYLCLSLAAFHGHHSLALALEALDLELECPNCGSLFERPSLMS